VADDARRGPGRIQQPADEDNLTPLKITPTALAVPASCTFVGPKPTPGGGARYTAISSIMRRI
jgi:hypothetical protein